MKIRIKMQGGLMFLGLGMIILLSNSAFPYQRQPVLDGMMNALGMGLILFGFLFRISARGYKEENTSNGNALVKTGPYAVIRNPMYFGTFIIGTGVVVMLLELWLFFLFAAVFFMIYFPQMKKEEKVLLERFGQEYKEYCQLTPKYFPRFDYLFRLNQYVSLKPFWIKKEIISLVTTVLVVIMIETWEYARLFWHK
ncbi:MAG: isoprenylcysteine carboxylmethyltransferase family protein [Candidatus Omnitrophica bacterium]|nr:isoprenylcysteine carboxylmethyltransferase family protein [Candidatus Omnitrophota bacterium]